MKISWGYKITFLYCSFAALIIFMVVKSMQQSIDLVSDNYYEKTLHYEQQINKMKNASLSDNKIHFAQKDKHLEIVFPQEKTIKGEIKFYKPDNASLDFAVNISDNKLIYNTSNLSKGKWRLLINWLVDDVQVYNEKTIVIN